MQRLKIHAPATSTSSWSRRGRATRSSASSTRCSGRGTALRVRPLLGAHGQRLAEGLAIRCRVALDFYPPPRPAPGGGPRDRPGLHARRARAPAGRDAGRARARRGCSRPTASSPLAALPLAVALVTSQGTRRTTTSSRRCARAASASGCCSCTPRCRGSRPSASVASALERAAGAAGRLRRAGPRRRREDRSRRVRQPRDRRGGGARDACPVLTGLGHEIDEIGGRPGGARGLQDADQGRRVPGRAPAGRRARRRPVARARDGRRSTAPRPRRGGARRRASVDSWAPAAASTRSRRGSRRWRARSPRRRRWRCARRPSGGA